MRMLYFFDTATIEASAEICKKIRWFFGLEKKILLIFTDHYVFKQGCFEAPKFLNCPPLTGSSWYLIDTFFFTRSKPYMATSFHTIDPLVQMESQLSTWCFIGGKGGIHNFGMDSINDVRIFVYFWPSHTVVIK